jgi:trehalose/maltose transport system substrate-binding protein
MAFMLALFLLCADARAEVLRFACDSVGLGARICKEKAQEWGRLNNYTVKLVQIPRSPTRRLELYKQMFDARSDKIDVLMIDIVWPGILASSLVDLRPAAEAVIHQHLPSMIANNTVQGRLVAMPWYIDAGLLFYRKDLLERYGAAVPQTWGELMRTARSIQESERRRGNRDLWGYVWQGKAYEGLTCNVVEWLASRGKGRLVDDNGRVTIDKPAMVEALQQAKSWIGDISPPEVLTADEDATNKAFSEGNAVFMRNWPGAWSALLQANGALRDKIGIARLPRGENGTSRATLGGQQLAVSRFSRHRDAAIRLVMYLTGRTEQKRLTLLAFGYPTMTDLYNDPDIRSLPYQTVIRDAVVSAVTRPSIGAGGHYEEVSRAMATAAHSVLAEGQDAAMSVNAMVRGLPELQARPGR